jgi:hypothetical protein
MSLLGLSNFLLFQWFFLRLAFVYDEVGGELKYRHWMFIHGIVPLTGWWGPYRYAWGRS